jgi:3-phenylpropionate/trans-cinnamate dioxygenase ferredoxin reductase component
MAASREILIVGGGPAGTFAAIAARKHDPAATVRLLTREACEPYEKPPLSKAVLLGKAVPADALIAGPAGVAGHQLVLETHAHCAAIDRPNRTVVLADRRRLPYDALVIATGSSPREIPLLPIGMPRVHYLRTEADARALQTELCGKPDVLVVGGGLIGLEVAAAAAMIGAKVTVLEVALRILARVCDEETAAGVHTAHARHGVDIRVGTSITSVATEADGRIIATTSDGERLRSDIVVVGTGSKPDDQLASAAGLAADDGIVVDAQCRTSDPSIFAAGDAVRFPGPEGLVRLENWRHAQDQGTVAGRNAAGAAESYTTLPSFWSEQYDLFVQGVGWPAPSASARIVRPGPAGSDASIVFHVDAGVVVHAMGINAQRDFGVVRRLIERRISVDPATLADPAQPLAAMLKR